MIFKILIMLSGVIKKPLFLVLIVMAAAIGLVSLLAWDALKPINENNEFSRTVDVTGLQMLNVMDKPEDIVCVAGTINNQIYFKTKNSSKIYLVDEELQNGKYLTLNVPNTRSITSLYDCIVDSPYIYICVLGMHG